MFTSDKDTGRCFTRWLSIHHYGDCTTSRHNKDSLQCLCALQACRCSSCDCSHYNSLCSPLWSVTLVNISWMARWNKKEILAHFTSETLRMPSGHHCLDYSADDELAAFATTWSKQDVEVMFAVLSVFKLIEDSVRERPEALGTSGSQINIRL